MQHEACCVCFRIATDDHDLLSELSESGHCVLTGRRLADAALTVNCNLSHVCFLGLEPARLDGFGLESNVVRYSPVLSNKGANGSRPRCREQTSLAAHCGGRVEPICRYIPVSWDWLRYGIVLHFR